MGHTSPALALTIYAQAMRRNAGERDGLRALVWGDYRALTGTEGESPVASRVDGVAA